jgi:hypothetical protein
VIASTLLAVRSGGRGHTGVWCNVEIRPKNFAARSAARAVTMAIWFSRHPVIVYFLLVATGFNLGALLDSN